MPFGVTDGESKTAIGSIKADQEGTITVGKHLGGPLTGSHVKFGSIVPRHCGGNCSTEQLQDLMPIIKDYTALDDRSASEDKTKISRETKSKYFDKRV